MSIRQINTAAAWRDAQADDDEHISIAQQAQPRNQARETRSRFVVWVELERIDETVSPESGESIIESTHAIPPAAKSAEFNDEDAARKYARRLASRNIDGIRHELAETRRELRQTRSQLQGKCHTLNNLRRHFVVELQRHIDRIQRKIDNEADD